MNPTTVRPYLPRAPRLVAAAGRAPAPTERSTIWILAAHAGRCSVQERDRFARTVAALGESDRADRLLLVTCHRAELLGSGPLSAAQEIAAALGIADLGPRLRLATGGDAIRHWLRLAAGLESSVVGENQILHQVRSLRESARRRPTDPLLARLLETSIAVGRTARAARSRAGWSDAGLAGGALDWLAARDCFVKSERLLIVGAGHMGRLLAVEARRRGISVTVASRDERHATTLAATVAGRGIRLAEAARVAPSHGAVAIALAGPWLECSDATLLPAVVDLSSPSAIAPAGTSAYLDIDGLHRWTAAEHPTGDGLAYAASASAVVEEMAVAFERWLAGRASVAVLRRLRDSAERRRQTETERLLDRLANLEPRDRAIVEAYSRRLVSGFLHEPSVRLREDMDGAAAAAARRLFDL
jgi:glutamyl-tRNA reductase